MAPRRDWATLTSGPTTGTDGSPQMNAYMAEIIAAERMATFEREAASARLVREARRTAATRPSMRPIRGSRVVAAGAAGAFAAFAVTLWSAVAP
jgi:hypothetical protein